MKEREAFLAALAADEDDVHTRLVYADWLEERGEHEEADRQRRWPQAKAWLVKFCEENAYPAEYDWVHRMTYDRLLARAQEEVLQYLQDPNHELSIACGNDEEMCDALRAHRNEFWQNAAIVLGVMLPAAVMDNSWFGCGC